MHKDISFENIETVLNNEKILKYTIGKICKYVPSEVYSLQQDGTLISRSRTTNDNPLFKNKIILNFNNNSSSDHSSYISNNKVAYFN